MRVSIAFAALLGLAVAAAGLLATVAIRKSNEADVQRNVAASRALAAAAMDNSNRSPDLAMLLALEAFRRVQDQSASSSYEARNTLVSMLTRHPRLLAVLHVDDDPAAAVSFSHDGRRLATSSDDGTIRLWHLKSRSQIGKPMRGRNTCYTDASDADLRFTRDGETLAHTGCGEATIFDVEHGTKLKRLGGPSDPLGEEETDAVLSPDGGMLAVYGEYVGFRVLDLMTGAPIRRGAGRGHDQLFPIVFSGDGRALAAGTAFTDKPVRVLAVDSGAPLGKPLPGRVLALSPTGSLAAVLVGGKVSLWDVVRATAVGKPLALGAVLGAEFDARGRRFAVSSDDGQVRVWRLTRTRRLSGLARLEHDGVIGLRFSPDGTTLATAGVDGTVRLWDVSRPVALAARMQGAGALEVEFSPDGRWLAVNGDSSTLLWTVDDGRIVGPPRRIVEGIGYDIQFSPSGRLIASGFEDPGEVGLWDVALKRPRKGLPTGEYGVYDVAFTPDNAILLAAGDNVTFFDAERRTPVGRRLRGGESWLFLAIALSPDGRTLAAIANEVGYESGALGFWSIEDRKPLGKLITGDRDAVDVVFSPDGRTVATGHDDGTLRLWDVSRRTLFDSLRAHSATSRSACCGGGAKVAISPDGLVLASGGPDGLRLWDMTRSAPLGGPIRGGYADVAFSPDGQMLVSANYDGPLLWDALLLSRDLEEWRSRLCGIASRNLTEAEWRRFLPDESYRKTCPKAS